MPAPVPLRPARRALRRRAARALRVALLLALVLPPAALPAPRPAGAQAPAASPTPGATPIPGSGPPANDPAGPPSAYTLARSDQLFVALTQQPAPGESGLTALASTYTLKPDLSGVSASTPGANTGVGVIDPSWPLLPVRGNFTDPLREQALLLSQSNDCTGTAGEVCAYSLLLRQAVAGGDAVASWLRVVQGPGGGSPVAVGAGDLDGVIDPQGFPNDEAVVAHRAADGTLQVAVLDYNAAPGEVVETGPGVALPQIGTAAAGPGSLGVGVGDFDADGQNEIAVLWQGSGCPAAPAASTAPPCLSAPHLSVLRYTNTGRTRSVAVLQPDAALPAADGAWSAVRRMGFQTAVDDFDGQGRDLLAVSYLTTAPALAVLGFVRGDPTFTVDRWGFSAGAFADQTYCPASGSGCPAVADGTPPQLAAGLFWYDEPSGHGLGRRQLAQVAAHNGSTGAGDVALQVFDVAFNDAACAPPAPCPLTLTGLLGSTAGVPGQPGTPWTVASGYAETAGAFPAAPALSLAAGSFQGLVLNPTEPGQVPWALAVGISGQQGASASSVVDVVRLSGTALGAFTAASAFAAESSAAAATYGPPPVARVLAYDPAGASLRLGAPLVYTLTGLNVPSYVLQDPPKHLDWFYDPQKQHGSWLQVDRTDAYNLTVKDDTTSEYSSQTDTTTSWTIGASVTVNATASGDAKIGKVADAGAGVSVSASVGYQNDKNHDWYTASSSSDTLSTSASTTDDDYVAGTMRTWQVYRYPIVNYALTDTDGNPILGPDGKPRYGVYELTLPGPTVEFQGGARSYDWYQPVHQNGIALSYPPTDSSGKVALDPSTLGPPVTLQGSGETPVTLPQPLFNHAYLVDATGSSVELTIAQTTGSGNTTKTNGTLSESVDADAGAWGKVDLGVGEADACADVDVKFENSNSWGSLNTSSTSTTSTNTFTLQQDSAAQPSWAYGAATAYYTDPLGTYRVAHAVDLMASAVGRESWKHYYSGKPDPALNLPNRMQLAYNDKDNTIDIPQWVSSDARQLIRGAWALRPDPDHGGQTGSMTAGAMAATPVDGDTLQLQVRVHNYSLDTPATGVPVEFWAVRRNGDDTANAGAPFRLSQAPVYLDTIPALGWAPANFLWSTAGMAPTGATTYRIFVIVARNDPANPNDPWNNVVHAWADRYDDPPTVDGTPPDCGTSACDRLVDPFTGQLETLEAGQNKQGWFEVTIHPKAPAPGPLAATAGAQPQPQPQAQLRFGSGGVRVTAPRSGRVTAPGAAPAAAPAAAAGTASEVRAHLAATALGEGNSVCANHDNSATLLVYDGAPEQGGSLVGMKRVTGLVGSGPAGRWVTLPWTPREAGRRRLVFRLHGTSMDKSARPVETTLEVDVAPPVEPPATLKRLLDIINVEWLPADLWAALVAQVGTANAAVLAGDQAGARTALAALRAQTAAAQGNTISGYSATRIERLADALLAQSVIAAACLPPAPAAAAAATPAAAAGAPAPNASPAAGALPPSPCPPGVTAGVATGTGTATPTGTVTPAGTGTPGTAVPTATATGTPGAGGTATPAARAAGSPTPAGTAGTPTPPGAGSPTPGAGSPTPATSGSPTPATTATASRTPAGTPSATPQRTATPAAPTVVPPPLPPPPTPAGPPRASDGQHLGLQPPAVQAAFVAHHGDAAAQRWAAEHEAALTRTAP